ncbi:MAG: cytochrome P450, partial [Halobacteria archaeon]|nr:cytochrome P450 [Halobacteria archaeon]
MEVNKNEHEQETTRKKEKTKTETGTERTPPGPSGLPFIGNTLKYVRDPCEFREKCVEEYGDVIDMNMLAGDYMVTQPEHVEQILVTERDKFGKPEFIKNGLGHFLGDGLLASEGELWRRQRQLMQPVFFGDKINEYDDIMADNSERWVRKWEDGEVYNIEHEMKDLSLRILIESMFGADIKYEEREIRSEVERLLKPAQPEKQPITVLLPIWMPIPMFRNSRKALSTLEDLIHEMIADRRQREDERDDLLSRLFRARDDDGYEMSDKQLRDEMMTILLAG